MTIEQTTTPSGELQKPSALIRKGIAIRPKQCFGDFYLDGGTCVFGAMYEGLTGQQPPSFTLNASNQEIDEMLILLEVATGIPIPKLTGERGETPLANEIFHHNDHDHWTREQNADWLESIGW